MDESDRNAGADGWIDITKMANDKVYPWGYEKPGLAFKSVGIDGKVRLSELGGDIKNAYVGVYMDNFGKTVSYFGLGGENFSDNLSAKVNEIYTNYMKEYNSLKDFLKIAVGFWIMRAYDDFSQEELNNIIVSLGTIIDDKNDGKAISLSELGINAIEKISDGKFLLKGDEQSYKVLDEPSKSKNSLKFYPKPVDILA